MTLRRQAAARCGSGFTTSIRWMAALTAPGTVARLHAAYIDWVLAPEFMTGDIVFTDNFGSLEWAAGAERMAPAKRCVQQLDFDMHSSEHGARWVMRLARCCRGQKPIRLRHAS